ncbi:uncharacterized protein V6R79_022930 [Siganus canaliculatus]
MLGRQTSRSVPGLVSFMTRKHGAEDVYPCSSPCTCTEDPTHEDKTPGIEQFGSYCVWYRSVVRDGQRDVKGHSRKQFYLPHFTTLLSSSSGLDQIRTEPGVCQNGSAAAAAAAGAALQDVPAAAAAAADSLFVFVFVLNKHYKLFDNVTIKIRCSVSCRELLLDSDICLQMQQLAAFNSVSVFNQSGVVTDGSEAAPL